MLEGYKLPIQLNEKAKNQGVIALHPKKNFFAQYGNFKKKNLFNMLNQFLHKYIIIIINFSKIIIITF